MKTADRTPTLVIDIETWASNNKPDYPPFKVSSGATKPETIQKQKDEYETTKEELRDKLWRKQALDSMRGAIICVCYAIDDADVQHIVGDTEQDILTELDNVLANIPYPIVVGWNISRFDLVWLFHRGLRYGLKNILTSLPNKKDDQAMMRDLMNVFSATSYGSDSWVSLDEAARFLGFPSKAVSGKDIHDLYVNGQIDVIIEHCVYDVELCRKIHKLVYNML